MLVRNASPLVAAWAGHRLGTTFKEPYHALGVMKNGRLAGAVIFNDYEARNVEMTLVGPNAFTRGVAREIFGYAFNELDCLRITVTIPEKHTGTCMKALRWGWIPEGRKRDYYGANEHAIIFGMLKDECRFLR
jgi:hypothetical protein